MSTKGLTVIELLVAIAIIAVLAAILFPVFSSSESRAQQAVCLSNLRQIQHALSLYSADHDGVVCPFYAKYNGDAAPTVHWPTLVLNYVSGNKQVFICPANVSPNSLYLRGNLDVVRFSCYGRNAYPFMLGYNEEKYTYPAEMMSLVDSRDGEVLGPPGVLAVHSGGASIVFMDGHVKWLGLASVPDVNAIIPLPSEGKATRHFWLGND